MVDMERFYGTTTNDVCLAVFHKMKPQLKEAFKTQMVIPLSRIPDNEEKDADADALRKCRNAAMEVILEALTGAVLKLSMDEQSKTTLACSLLVRRAAEIMSVANNQAADEIVWEKAKVSSENQDIWLARAERARRIRKLNV
ncbi:MAG: hypothetical protein Q9157_003245 [Trypethelium eluteriae]